VNDRDEEIEYRDPHFNDLDEPGFSVARNVRFVLSNVASLEHDTDDEAIENFRKVA